MSYSLSCTGSPGGDGNGKEIDIWNSQYTIKYMYVFCISILILGTFVFLITKYMWCSLLITGKLVMVHVLFAMNFDISSLRSTRTRIAKVEPARRRERVVSRVKQYTSTSSSPPRPPPEGAEMRDWGRHMGYGVYGRMRVIFLGHNPSDKSWDFCAPYAHGSNRFWKLLADAKLAPHDMCEPSKHVEYPEKLGLAFSDLIVTKGSVAADVKDVVDPNAVAERILKWAGGTPPRILACVSKSVAQKFMPGWKGKYGPAGYGGEWRLKGMEDVSIWVLPSTSGRAGLKWAERLQPFVQLSSIVKQWPWPENEEDDEEEEAQVLDKSS